MYLRKTTHKTPLNDVYTEHWSSNPVIDVEISLLSSWSYYGELAGYDPLTWSLVTLVKIHRSSAVTRDSTVSITVPLLHVDFVAVSGV
jgi:hypothetical protein